MNASDPPSSPSETGAVPTAGTLLRYLLPVGLCEEPRGDVFLAHAMLERNKQALKRWMPHYAKVHTVLAGALLGFCSGASAAEASGWVLAVAAIPTAGEVGLAITFGCVALGLRLGSD